jgi:hypothetical protein
MNCGGNIVKILIELKSLGLCPVTHCCGNSGENLWSQKHTECLEMVRTTYGRLLIPEFYYV